MQASQMLRCTGLSRVTQLEGATSTRHDPTGDKCVEGRKEGRNKRMKDERKKGKKKRKTDGQTSQMQKASTWWSAPAPQKLHPHCSDSWQKPPCSGSCSLWQTPERPPWRSADTSSFMSNQVRTHRTKRPTNTVKSLISPYVIVCMVLIMTVHRLKKKRWFVKWTIHSDQ